MATHRANHEEKEHYNWDIDIPDHPPRKDSNEYTRSRAQLKKLLAHASTVKTIYFGELASEQCHHGGGMWAWEHDDPEHGEPFLLRNLAGVEWSAQFAADAARIDLLRQNAARLYEMFPRSVAMLDKMGANASTILKESIVDQAGIERWVDSIFNASVPLPVLAHTGVLPKGGGVHHYPEPISSIAFIKRDDFTLWVTDAEGQPAAVVPVAPIGSPDQHVMVLWSAPGSALNVEHEQALNNGHALLLSPTHPLAKMAFHAEGNQ